MRIRPRHPDLGGRVGVASDEGVRPARVIAAGALLDDLDRTGHRTPLQIAEAGGGGRHRAGTRAMSEPSADRTWGSPAASRPKENGWATSTPRSRTVTPPASS